MVVDCFSQMRLEKHGIRHITEMKKGNKYLSIVRENEIYKNTVLLHRNVELRIVMSIV